jgi:SAM-dependent methyltransferase
MQIELKGTCMGLARAAVHLLIREAIHRPFAGSIVTLGRQHVYVTSGEVNEMATNCGLSLRRIPIELHREPDLAKRGFVSDDWLLKSLGFDEIVRVDYSNYESSEVILDLNDLNTPDSLATRFDVVLDSGTLEHVFDIAAGLRHCVRMVRTGGRVIHLTPSSNCVEHGFYSVSPTLYADFYSASGFRVDKVWLCEIPLDLPRGVWNVYDYLGAPERFIALGQLSDQIWFTYSIATAERNVAPKSPQQWIYTQTWAKANEDIASGDNSDPEFQFEAGSRSQKLMNILTRTPWLKSVAAKGIVRWRRWRYQSQIRNRRLPYPLIGKF